MKFEPLYSALCQVADKYAPKIAAIQSDIDKLPRPDNQLIFYANVMIDAQNNNNDYATQYRIKYGGYRQSTIEGKE